MPLDKAQQKLRKELGKAVAAELKKRSRDCGWKISQGWLFRQQDGWFVDARPSVWVMDSRTTLELFAKPMSIDPIFWDIANTPCRGFASRRAEPDQVSGRLLRRASDNRLWNWGPTCCAASARAASATRACASLGAPAPWRCCAR